MCCAIAGSVCQVRSRHYLRIRFLLRVIWSAFDLIICSTFLFYNFIFLNFFSQQNMEKTYLHRFLQGIALVQQISNQFLSDRKLWRQFYATLDRVWVTAIQELWSIKTVILPGSAADGTSPTNATNAWNKRIISCCGILLVMSWWFQPIPQKLKVGT